MDGEVSHRYITKNTDSIKFLVGRGPGFTDNLQHPKNLEEFRKKREKKKHANNLTSKTSHWGAGHLLEISYGWRNM